MLHLYLDNFGEGRREHTKSIVLPPIWNKFIKASKLYKLICLLKLYRRLPNIHYDLVKLYQFKIIYGDHIKFEVAILLP